MKIQTITTIVSQQAKLLTPKDNIVLYATPKLGVFKHRPGAAINEFSKWLGRNVDIAIDFANRSSWDLAPDWSIIPCSNWVKAELGRNLSYALPMFPSGSGITLRQVADGAGDAAFRTLANRLIQYGLYNAYLRPGWEMDLTGTSWGNAPQGSGREQDFAAAFRRIVTVMRQAQPVNNWKFELVTGQGWRDRMYLDLIWPGDEFVDHVGMDFYEADWFSYADGYPVALSATPAQRLRAHQQWWNRYSWWLYTMRDFALEHGKEVCIPEWSCANSTTISGGGGDSPAFIESMHKFINDPSNKVVWHGIYSITPSWQIEPPTEMPNAGAKFKELFAPVNDQFRASGFIE